MRQDLDNISIETSAGVQLIRHDILVPLSSSLLPPFLPRKGGRDRKKERVGSLDNFFSLPSPSFPFLAVEGGLIRRDGSSFGGRTVN